MGFLARILLKIAVVVLPLAILAAGGYYFYKTFGTIKKLESEVNQLKEKTGQLDQNLPEFLYSDHLAYMNAQSLEFQLADLQAGSGAQQNVDAIYTIYSDFTRKLSRNNGVKLDTKTQQEAVAKWPQMLLDKDLVNLQTQMTEANTSLDKSYQGYLATLPPPQITSAEGYSYQTVKTEKGTHGVYLIKVPLSSVTVKTVAAISSDCGNNCATKSLAEYVKENNGYAGMNGSYICPPDYASCAGKTNTFDYAFFASNHDKWLNKKALTWFKTGMFTFSGHSSSFYKKTSEYGGGGVDAAISNYPSLLKNGEIVLNDSELTAYQRLKGMKGAIGVGGENLYLALISNATMEEAAYVMKTLGAKHALNLDGGGTSAMYINGGYVVGPGRALPNAIVLVK